MNHFFSKNMNLKKLILPAIAALLFVSSCKYEDGPAISFRSKRDRIANEWVVDKITIDGKDSTELLKGTNDTPSAYTFVLHMYRTNAYGISVLKKAEDGKLTYIDDFNGDSTVLVSNYYDNLPLVIRQLGNHGTWTWNRRHDKIWVNPELSGVKNANPPVYGWDIVELREKQLKIKGECTYINTFPRPKYEITFKRLNTKEPYWL